MRARVFAYVAAAAFSFAGTARATEPAEVPSQQATFALIIGSNQSVDPDAQPLRYADDDAARYFDLFRLLGARTYLLARLDDNTRRLHAQAAAEASEPRRAQLDRAVSQLVADVSQAATRGVRTVVYVFYAGHGSIKDGKGYLTLEDARITGGDLADIVHRIPATRIHVVADACASYYLAHSRGPGGERRALTGFRASALADDPRVGLLLSTSSARESHEWEAFQGGVFSHEVRSGLYGGADANGDGIVSYPEIAAFIANASASVPNEKYRPDVYAHAPQGSDGLLEIRHALRRRVVIEGEHAGHYFMEDTSGVRLADVHNAAGHTLSLLLPSPRAGRIYVRRQDRNEEFTLDPSSTVVTLGELAPTKARSQARGAEHDAFTKLFALPFDESVVTEYRERTAHVPAPEKDADAPPRDSEGLRRTLAVGAFGLALAGAGVGTYFAVSANTIAENTSATMSNAEVADRNDRIHAQSAGSIVSFSVAGAAAVTGAALLLWPRARHVQAVALPGGAFVGYRASFF